MKDSRIGDEKLLVAWSNKRCGKICRRVRPMSEDEESNRRTGRKTEVE